MHLLKAAMLEACLAFPSLPSFESSYALAASTPSFKLLLGCYSFSRRLRFCRHPWLPSAQAKAQLGLGAQLAGILAAKIKGAAKGGGLQALSLAT